MKADFSRLTFDKANRFSRVLMQQGRILLDADWNESAAIQIYFLRALARHVMGPHAAPADDDGAAGTSFVLDKRIKPDGTEVQNDFSIGAGQYYVQGILCENTAGAFYKDQIGLRPGEATFEDARPYLVYLDVWERHLTDTEVVDPFVIREPALGLADTCTRSVIVWQVRAVKLDPEPADPAIFKNEYGEFLDALALTPLPKLSAHVEQPPAPEGPCLAAPESRYRRTENQLYRVEIHTGGDNAAATFKWSRENGSQIYPVVNVSGSTITLSSVGHDDRSMLRAGQYVELVDEVYTLLFNAGQLMQIVTVDGEMNQVTVNPAPASNTGTRRLLRQWNAAPVGIAAATAAGKNGWIPLEDGIEVKFDPANDGYQTGQYWLIPARTATGNIIWPQQGSAPAFREPHGIEHSYAPLGVIRFNAGALQPVQDLRRKINKIWS
jgi:hypothetical protein